jgi:putative aminopeptidase FrvX
MSSRTRRRVLLALGLLLLFAPGSTARQPTTPARWDIPDPIQGAQAVSGYESDVIAAIRQGLPRWASPRVDEIGNLIVTIGQGAPHLLITTSVDEDGYLVSDITPEGYLRLHRVTTGVGFRLFDQFIYGQPVTIRTTAGRTVPGVVGSLSAHLQRGREQATAARGLDDVWVDVGAQSSDEVAALGVRLLDTVALRERGTSLAGGRSSGLVNQARQSARALLDVLRGRSEAPKVAGTLTIAWTTQGQFGERGAARLARQLSPDRVIVVARAQPAREPDPRGALGNLGGGPIVSESSAWLVERAREAGVAVQATPSLQAPQAWPAAVVQSVALPVLFMQTPVETVDQADVAALTSLLSAAAGLPAAVGSARPVSSPVPASASAPAALGGPFVNLAPLVEAYGVSGHETAVREAVEKQLPAWAKREVDAKGNLTVSFGQGPGPEILLVAHTDELGCQIVEVREDGMALVRRCGVSAANMEAHPVLVHAATGIVPAVFAPRPGYQRATEWQPRAEDQILYFGTASRAATEALGVGEGDTVTVRKRFQPLAGSRATGRSIDDRAGCAALALALAKIDPAKVRSRVTFAWDVEEETGLAGAGVLAERLRPAYVFAVDTFVSSDTPIDPPRYAHNPLGSGVVLRAVDTSSLSRPEVVARATALASARGIPVTVGMTSGGNDGSQFSKLGSLLLPLSWPGRYSHSAVEVIDGRDLQALVDLIVAIVSDWR